MWNACATHTGAENSPCVFCLEDWLVNVIVSNQYTNPSVFLWTRGYFETLQVVTVMINGLLFKATGLFFPSIPMSMPSLPHIWHRSVLLTWPPGGRPVAHAVTQSRSVLDSSLPCPQRWHFQNLTEYLETRVVSDPVCISHTCSTVTLHKWAQRELTHSNGWNKVVVTVYPNVHGCVHVLSALGL